MSLKKCPFCGEEATYDTDRAGRYYAIICTNRDCEASIRIRSNPYIAAEKEARLRWNRREAD